MSQPMNEDYSDWQRKYPTKTYFHVYWERDYKQDMLQAIRRYYANTKRHIIFPRFKIPKG